jgi:hypothetical protein
MSYTSYTRRHHQLLTDDPYDYQLTSPPSYRTSHHRHHANDYLNLDALPYPKEPHYVPPFTYKDTTLGQVGDYVSRRLVPSMLRNSDLPLQLVMNFGNLQLDSNTSSSDSRSGSNAVVYNAPGGRITMGSPRRQETDTYGKKVGICVGCYKRHLVGSAGYCWDCELGVRVAETDGHRSFAYGDDGDRLDRLGIRYVKTPEWIGAKREERDRARGSVVELERELGGDWDREWERRAVRTYYGLEGEDGARGRYGRHGRYGTDRW